MAKSKTKLIFEDDFEDEEKEILSPEDQAAWEEMETYFSESLNQFKEGQVIHGKIIEISKGMATVDVGFKSEGIVQLHEFPEGGKSMAIGDEVEVFLERVEDNLDRYEALDAGHIFDVEYWDLEQAKLRLAGPPAELAGMVAVVTGAASGIGRACAAELLARGCAVGGIDIDPGVASTFDSPAWLGLAADVSDPEAQAAAIADIVERFGGLDIVLVAAGIFGKSTPISGLDAENYRIVQAVNVDAVVNLLHTTHPFLARSPVGGRVSIIGSKNVAAPGKGALSYSTSKAALSQVARVATLEWADDAIRVNTVHPDAVFDTGLWNDELLRERADNYGLTVDEYKTRNLLRTEVTSAGVARVAVELCTDTFSATTGAHIPIDGGNERVV